MKRLQERSARISEVQRVHDALREIQEGRAGAEGRRSQLDRRIADARVALLNLKKERSRIESEVEFRTCTGLRERIGSLEEELERTGREFTVISAALAHVFRKAEKVTGRKSDSAGAKAVRHVTELLSSHQVPSPKELAESLKITLPIVLPLIASGEVALKNKEERALFSEPERLVSILERSAAEYYSCTARLVAAKEDLAANPVVARLTQIETELRQIEKTIARGEAQGVELAQQQDDSAGAIPTLVDELDRTVAVLAGGRVRLQAGALNSMMEKREKSV
jgi:chromosome segregation ATPase